MPAVKAANAGFIHCRPTTPSKFWEAAAIGSVKFCGLRYRRDLTRSRRLKALLVAGVATRFSPTTGFIRSTWAYAGTARTAPVFGVRVCAAAMPRVWRRYGLTSAQANQRGWRKLRNTLVSLPAPLRYQYMTREQLAEVGLTAPGYRTHQSADHWVYRDGRG